MYHHVYIFSAAEYIMDKQAKHERLRISDAARMYYTMNKF